MKLFKNSVRGGQLVDVQVGRQGCENEIYLNVNQLVYESKLKLWRKVIIKIKYFGIN